MSKESENFKFILHGKLDVSSIISYLSDTQPDWFKNTYRQDEYQMHKETSSIFIYDYPVDWKPGSAYQANKMTDDVLLLELSYPIINYLENIHNGRVGKAVFIKLPPLKNVDKHKDVGSYLESVRRNHIPIATNNKVSFIIDGERQFMDIGEVWEVNNNKTHQVWNDGETDRIHFLVDIVPNKMIGK